MDKIYHIVIEGSNQEQMQKLFEEIQNKYGFYDNCVLETANPEDTIIDDDRRDETGHLEILKRCCNTCKHFNPKDKTCNEGGLSEIGNPNGRLTKKDCNAWEGGKK